MAMCRIFVNLALAANISFEPDGFAAAQLQR